MLLLLIFQGYTFNKKNVRIAVKYCVIFPVLMYAALSWDKVRLSSLAAFLASL